MSASPYPSHERALISEHGPDRESRVRVTIRCWLWGDEDFNDMASLLSESHSL